jgi:hypothetical protein
VKQERYGLMAEFETAEALAAAAREAYQQGYRQMDAYSPVPVEGLAEALGEKKSPVPAMVLTGGVLGGVGGYFLQYYASVIDYPIVVGGKPYHSWPAFVPVAFETTILAAALAAVVGMIIVNRLPMPYHPVFNVPRFERASRDRFFLCLEAADPKFDWPGARKFLEGAGAYDIFEVEK